MATPGRRIGTVALLVGMLAAVLAAAGPDALLPFEDLARAAAAETTVSVAFVVDFGGSTGPVVGCVKVPSGTSGYQALAAFTAQEQEQTPTYNAAGLLCSIDDQPASGCGQVVNGGYVYWSYWHGASGSWQYASAGAFAAVQDGDVEGWRFENPGKANASDPPPAASPDYAAVCGSTTTATTGASAATPNAASSPATAPPGGAAGGQSASPVPTSGSAGASTVPPPTTPTTLAGTAGSGSRPPVGAVPSTTAPHPGTRPQSLRASAAAAGGSDGAVLPAALGAGLVLVLAALAAWRWRKRSADP